MPAIYDKFVYIPSHADGTTERPDMKRYTFNIQLTVEVEAENYEKALELVDVVETKDSKLIDEDIMLVDEEDLEHDCSDADRPCDDCLTSNLPVFDGE